MLVYELLGRQDLCLTVMNDSGIIKNQKGLGGHEPPACHVLRDSSKKPVSFLWSDGSHGALCPAMGIPCSAVSVFLS